MDHLRSGNEQETQQHTEDAASMTQLWPHRGNVGASAESAPSRGPRRDAADLMSG